jgi:uncharacterized protein YhhL (DUF1145 family)
MNSKFINIFLFIIISIGVVVHAINFFSPIPKEVFSFSHIFVGVALLIHAIKRKGLTTWIFWESLSE